MTNYPHMSPEFEAELLAEVLAADGFDTVHQGDGTVLFTDETLGSTVHYRFTVERVEETE